MNNSQKALMGTKLFAGVAPDAAKALVGQITASREIYPKGGVIVMQGEPVSRIGAIISGRAVGERVRSNGFASTVSELADGDLFGDVLSGSNVTSPVTVFAETEVEAVFVELDELIRPRLGCEAAGMSVVKNLIREISDKYFAQNERISLLTSGSLRTRAAGYILKCSAGRNTFSVRHSREGMARYLGADRSALSRELSRMRDEGMISYFKTNFEILDMVALAEAAG